MTRTTMACMALLAVLLAGCAGNRLVGKQEKVASIPAGSPGWVQKSAYEDGGKMFFRGAVNGRSDMALGLREARAEAEKTLSESVRQRIRTEFGSAIEGQNLDGNTGSYVRDVIAKVSENVEISGVSQDEQYVEKLQERTRDGVRYVWDCYALVSVSRADYLEARANVLKGAIAQAKAAYNRKAELSLDSVRAKLEAAPVVVQKSTEPALAKSAE